MHHDLTGTMAERFERLDYAVSLGSRLTEDVHNRDDLVAAVGELQLVREQADVLQQQVAAAARQAGASWTAIARVLGVTPQAVQQRHGG